MEGSGDPPIRLEIARPGQGQLSRALPLVFAAAVTAILAGKLLLVWRINVNWDEFFYLSKVHALVRGELDLLLQGAYTHLFRWVATSGANEVDQIVELRLLMWGLLSLSVFLLYRFARRWASPTASILAVLAFVGSWPVMKHGASFRADSLLLPLTLGALLLVTSDMGPRRRYDIAAGLCFGTALTLTTKAVLMAPVLLLLTVLPDRSLGQAGNPRVCRVIERIASILVPAVLLTAALITVHSFYVVTGTESAGSFAERTVSATLIEVPLLPRVDYFMRLIAEDAIFWMAIPAGLMIAARLRAYAAIVCVLALLPVLFYRNAFPYYYPLMMAPSTVLVALSADWLLRRPPLSGTRAPGLVALALLGLLVMHNSWAGLMALRFDAQQQQRSVVAAVHAVFPAPVPYIDHSGMIASFPKVGFFMSSWGMEAYRRQGRNIMPELLATSRPPLLLVNHPVLQPGSLLFRQLTETDRRLLETSYVDYWGPIKVAGVDMSLPAEGVIQVRVPFAGTYRVDSAAPIRVNGRFLMHGDELRIDDVEIPLAAGTAQAGTLVAARLVWADARGPPREPPPQPPLYSPL